MQYGKLAGLYDRLMYDAPYEKWLQYLQQKLQGCRSVVELGCGTGTATAALAARIPEVVAIDLSGEMLQIAAEKLRRAGRRARLVQADMTAFELHRRADAALCLCDGINCLTEPGQVTAAFRNVRREIRDGGVFLFDISSERKLRNMAQKQFFEDSDDATYLWTNSFDEQSRVLTMEIAFFLPGTDGRYDRFDEEHHQRAHTVEEIRQQLVETGFSVESITDDYTDNEDITAADRITFTARAV